MEIFVRFENFRIVYSPKRLPLSLIFVRRLFLTAIGKLLFFLSSFFSHLHCSIRFAFLMAFQFYFNLIVFALMKANAQSSFVWFWFLSFSLSLLRIVFVLFLCLIFAESRLVFLFSFQFCALYWASTIRSRSQSQVKSKYSERLFQFGRDINRSFVRLNLPFLRFSFFAANAKKNCWEIEGATQHFVTTLWWKKIFVRKRDALAAFV